MAGGVAVDRRRPDLPIRARRELRDPLITRTPIRERRWRSDVLRICVKPHTLVRMPAWSALAELSHPGDSIRERRIELGWTQAELAKRSGIPQADISRIENGRLDARWSTIQRISTALAETQGRQRRSLANGGRVAEAPKPPSKKWSAKGTTIAITSVTK